MLERRDETLDFTWENAHIETHWHCYFRTIIHPSSLYVYVSTSALICIVIFCDLSSSTWMNIIKIIHSDELISLHVRLYSQ